MIKTILLAGVLAIVPSTVSAAELIGNGSFENPGITDSCCTTVPNATLADWTIEKGNVNIVNGTFGSNSGNLAYDGKQYLDLIGEGGAGSLSQTFGTKIGQLYTLTFAYSHNLFSDLQSASAVYSVAGLNGSITHTTGSNTGLDWKTVNVNFLAMSENTKLLFTNTAGSANEGVFLDGVSVVAAVPEPSTWALFLLGFFAVGGAMRSKTRKSTIAVSYA